MNKDNKSNYNNQVDGYSYICPTTYIKENRRNWSLTVPAGFEYLSGSTAYDLLYKYLF